MVIKISMLILGLLGLVAYFAMDYAIPLLYLFNCPLTRLEIGIIIEDTLIGQAIPALVMTLADSVFIYVSEKPLDKASLVIIGIWLIPVVHLVGFLSFVFFCGWLNS